MGGSYNEGVISIECERVKYPNSVIRIDDNAQGFSDDVSFDNTESIGLNIIQNLALQLKGNVVKGNSKERTNFIINF